MINQQTIPAIERSVLTEMYRKFYPEMDYMSLIGGLSGDVRSRDGKGYFFFFDHDTSLLTNKSIDSAIMINSSGPFGVMIFFSDTIPIESEVYSMGSTLPDESELINAKIEILAVKYVD